MATIEKTKTGSGEPRWMVRWDVDVNGKRVQKKRRFDSSKEAHDFLADVVNKLRTGTYADSHGLTLEEYLNDWLDTYVHGKVRSNSEASYKRDVKRIIRYIGSVQLDKLNPLTIQKAYNQMQEEIVVPEKTKTEKEMTIVTRPARCFSTKSLKNLHEVLHSALERARIDGLISRNPSEDIVLPQVKKRDHVIPTPEQIAVLLKETESSECAEVIHTCLYTGCRRGEALGLYWSDIDFEASTITFNRAYITNGMNSNKGELGELKTGNGKRTVYLPDVLRDELLKIKQEQEEQNQKDGKYAINSPFVFLTASGKPFEPHSITQAFTRAANRAGLNGMHLHDLRHTVITYMLEAGVNPRTVSEIAGHSSPAFTMAQYGHVLQTARKDASDAFMKTAFLK